MKNLTALILAAGIGKRFWPLQGEKVLFPFFGRSAFELAISSVLPKEITRAIVVSSTATQAYFKKFSFSVPHDTVVQNESGGMRDAMLAAEHLLSGDPVLIYIADDFVDADLFDRVIKKAHDSDAFGVLPGWKTDTYFPGGYLVTQGDRVVGIKEKPGEGNTPSNYVYVSGTYIANPAILLQELKKSTEGNDDIFENVLTSLMSQNKVIMEPYEGEMVSLKYPWHVLDVMHHLFRNLAHKRANNITVKNNVIIEGNVVIGDNVTIYENTKLIGPCFIGANTIIGNNNMIRESHIGNNCVTGFNTDITRSYIGDDCWLHSNYIGDSVLESNISLGGGTKLANLRLDEGNIFSLVEKERISTNRNKLGAIIGSDTHIGINASIMPGIKIGRESFVGAGVLLDQDMPEKSFCMSKSEVVMKKNTGKVVQRSRADFREKLKKYV